MVKVVTLCGVAALLCTLIVVSDGAKSVSKPSRCKKHDSWFSDRKEYRYTYTGVVQSAITGTTDHRSGFMFTCVLLVTSPRKCEMTLKVKKCNIKERTSNPEDQNDPFQEMQESKDFSAKMSKNLVYFQMREGLIVDDTVIVADDEPLEVINVKRGMLSALQLKMLNKELYESPQTVVDIYGSCPTHFEKTGDSSVIHSRRDLTTCSYPEIFLYQFRLYSMLNELTGSRLKKNYTEMIYPFESAIDCDYKIKGSNLEMVTCFHHQAMIPFTYNGSIKAGAMTNISQVLELDEVVTHRSKKIDRSLKDRHLVKLEYDFGEPTESEFSSDDMFELLYQMRQAASSSVKDIPHLFNKFVQKLRSSTAEMINQVYDSVKACPESKCDRKTKAVMDSFMVDGLMSCGSPACISEISKQIAYTQVDSYLVSAFLLDLAMNYNSATDSIVSNVLEICKTKKTGNCLLWLSGVVRAFGAKLDKEQLQNQEGAVYKTLHYIRDQLGENCKAGIFKNDPNNPDQLTEFITALKAVGTIGHFAQVSFDEITTETRQLIPALLNCAENSDLPDVVVKSALQALQKMYLDDTIRDRLFQLTNDPTQTVIMRTTAFSILVRDEKRSTIKTILQLLKEEKNSHLRTYMLSSVVNILESSDPRFRTLQSMWKTLLSEVKETLPELEVFLYRKSRYGELSRVVVIPLLNTEIGITAEVNIVYEPVSFLPHSLTVNISVNRDGVVHHLFEVGADISGFETLTEALFGEKKNSSKMGAKEILQFLTSGMTMPKIQAAMAQMEAARKAASKAAQAGAGLKLPPGYKLPPGFKPPPGSTVHGKGGPGPVSLPPMPPGMAAMMEMLKKPNMSYISDDFRSRFQNIFEDVNYPRLTFPSGHMYVKFRGVELGYTTLETLIAKIKSYTSTKGVLQMINLQKLMDQLGKGKSFVSGFFAKFLDVHKTIPTQLGLPLKLSVDGTRALLLDIFVKANIKGIAVKGEPVNGNATAAVSGAWQFSGEISVPMPTLPFRTGLKTNLTNFVNVSVAGGLAFAQRELTLFRENIEGPRNLLSVQGNLYLLHRDTEELLPGSRDHTVNYEKCTSPKLTKVTGRKLCWVATYQNASGSEEHPYFPLTGPVTADLVLSPVDTELHRYNLVFKLNYLKEPVEGLQDPKAFHLIRHTTVEYTAAGESLQRRVLADFKRNMNTTNLAATLSIPEYDNTLLTFKSAAQVPSVKSPSSSKDWTLALERGGEMQYEMSTKVKTDVTFEKVSTKKGGEILAAITPIRHTIANISLAIPNVSLTIDISSVQSKAGAKSVTEIDMLYFCSRRQSLLYLVHPDPKLAKKNGDRTAISVRNEGLFTKTTGRDWKVTDNLELVYPGQKLIVTNIMRTEDNRRHVYRDTEATWLNKDNKEEKLTMNAHAENKSDSFQINFDFDTKINRVNKYTMNVEGKMKGTAFNLDGDMEINYLKTGSKGRQKRSWDGVASAFKKYENKLKKAATYIGEVFKATTEDGSSYSEENMQADDPVVSFMDRDDWKITSVFNLKRKPMASGPGDSEVSANITYPRADTYHDVRLWGHYLRGFDPIQNGLRLLFQSDVESTYLDKKLSSALQVFRSPSKVTVQDGFVLRQLSSGETLRKLNVSMNMVREKEFSYYRSIMSPPINSTLDVSLKRGKDQTSLAVKSETSCIWKPINHKYKRMTVVLSNQMSSSANFSNSLGSLKGNSFLQWGLPNKGVSYTLDYDWKGKTKLFPSRKANLKLSFDNVTLPTMQLVSKQPDIHKTTIVNGKLLSPTELELKILTQKKNEKSASEAASWKATLTAHDRIRNDVSWKPEIGHMVFNKVKSRVNQTFIAVTDTMALFFSNFKRNFTDRIIPGVNKTWGELGETYIKPTYMKIISHLNEIPVPLSEKSMGEVVVMVHQRLKAYREELKARLYDTFPGHILQHSGIREKIIYLLSERIPQYLKSLQKQRPPFTRTVFTRKIMPLIEKRLREAETSFNISHPFIWEKFMSVPRVSHSARAIATALSRNVPRYMRQEWVWKSFSFNSMLFGDNLVRTFDGQLYRLPEFKLDKCSHLLAADFRDGKFALISTKDSITYFSPSTTVRLNNRCKVYLDQSQIPIDLPWHSSDEQTSVMIDGRVVDMTIKKWGIQLRCDIQDRRTYINLSGFHFNHSLGILGTNDREPSTDFRLPSGQVTKSISKFLNSYELSGDSSCLHDEVPKTCGRSSLKKCQEYFQLSSSPLKACFMHINPRHFMESCDSITKDCDVDDPKQLACDLSSAYVNICRQRGIQVSEPCGFCGKKSLGDIWRENIQDKVADIVFVISRHSKVAKGGNLAESVMNLVKKMKYQDDQYGLVTYGSAMLRSQALTHTLGGELFGSEKDLNSALKSLTLDSDTHYPAFDALMKALKFNFRPNSHRMIFLITEWTHATAESSIYTPQMLSLLANNSVTLNIISMYEPLSPSRVLAVRYNDQATMLNGRNLKIPLPQDEYAELLKVSKGSMFYLEKIMSGGKKLLRHFQRHIQEETESNHAGMCRECGCYAGPTGGGVTMCKSVKC